ncbi:MAG: prolipoprotein diacylglyceryl transferase [Oscillospiraceae bacterium]|nr:prolipoprotein diacylglyceryl transferase [Oscillospiraceae bacterium]
MYTEISFPSLGITIDPASTFSIGPLTIHYYGLIIACGLILAVLYCSRRGKEFGINEDTILDGVLWITPFAILCARAYYCIFTWESYADDPISVLYIWKGGLAIYGGVIGAAVGIVVFCKIRKIKIPMLLDLVSLGFLIGQSLGRWGNFFNREAFGAETDSFLRMGLMNAYTGEITYHHPTFLYESVWNAVGFLLLHKLSKRRKFDGQVALGYAAWYGLGRTFIEGLRTDSLYIGPIRVSQLLAAVSCAAALAVLVWQMFRPHDPADLYVNQLAAKQNGEKEE